MATKIQAVLDLARIPLNDDKDVGGSDAACRSPDSKLLTYALHALLLLFRRRPDLFVGSFSNPPALTWTANTDFPLTDDYVQVVADYVTARVEAGDDESVLAERAAMFFAMCGQDVP